MSEESGWLAFCTNCGATCTVSFKPGKYGKEKVRNVDAPVLMVAKPLKKP